MFHCVVMKVQLNYSEKALLWNNMRPEGEMICTLKTFDCLCGIQDQGQDRNFE